MKKVPPELDKIVDVVLAYRPKKKLKKTLPKSNKRQTGKSSRQVNK